MKLEPDILVGQRPPEWLLIMEWKSIGLGHEVGCGAKEEGLIFLSPQKASGTKPQLVSSRHRGCIIVYRKMVLPLLTPYGLFKQLSPHKWQAEVNYTALIEDCQKYQHTGGGRTWVLHTSALLVLVGWTWSAVGPELSWGIRRKVSRICLLGCLSSHAVWQQFGNKTGSNINVQSQK